MLHAYYLKSKERKKKKNIPGWVPSNCDSKPNALLKHGKSTCKFRKCFKAVIAVVDQFLQKSGNGENQCSTWCTRLFIRHDRNETVRQELPSYIRWWYTQKVVCAISCRFVRKWNLNHTVHSFLVMQNRIQIHQRKSPKNYVDICFKTFFFSF